LWFGIDSGKTLDQISQAEGPYLLRALALQQHGHHRACEPETSLYSSKKRYRLRLCEVRQNKTEGHLGMETSWN
jgi:hypothetical protein